MLKKKSPLIALCLVVPFVLASNAFAGHFGFFRHGRTKAKCCPVTCCPTEAVSPSSVKAVPEPPRDEYEVVCYVRATAIGMNSMGYTCTASSDWLSNEDCDTAKALANTQATDRLSNQPGCTLQRVVFDCVPPQYCTCCQGPAVKAMPVTGCQYKVTYTLSCCNGKRIEYTATDPDRAIAKKRARDAAYFWASLECGGRVYRCRWKICRTPSAAR